ncbi:hypothetical protein D3C75_946300 [compost metagenome]
MKQFYAEVMESKRFHGTRILEVHEFATEKEQEAFINNYNSIHLNHEGRVPDTYTIAHECSIYTIMDYKAGRLKLPQPRK